MTTAAVIGLDDLFQRVVLDDDAEPFGSRQEGSASMWLTVSGMLYGGITEELVMRWGFLSLLVWTAWRVGGDRKAAPRPLIFYGAILGAALLFGAAHLGAVNEEARLSVGIVIRTVSLNAIGGCVFGWLFWKKSLEAAMAAHATGHVVFAMHDWLLLS